jgi:glycosyltransferase involved in cell wall biosynthesis
MMKSTIDTSNLHGASILVVTNSFIDISNGSIIIGGTETYTDALIRVAERYSCQSIILQKSKVDFEMAYKNGSKIVSWASKSDLVDKMNIYCRNGKSISVIYQEDQITNNICPTVLIQHGVGWDGTSDNIDRSFPLIKVADLRRRYRLFAYSRNFLKTCSNLSRVICVDTNFINTMRVSWPMYDWGDYLTYIPNFADVHPAHAVREKWDENRSPLIVLFARRFAFHRGAYLWLSCLKTLAADYPEVEFRVVGFGEAENSLKELAITNTNLKIFSRPYTEMPGEHLAAHISVIPSLWSEGTSLSCIESMAAGCAIVASNVGGLCNLVVPGFNGMLIPPVGGHLTRAVSELIDNRTFAMDCGRRSYEMACAAFGRELWETRVAEVLADALRKPNPKMPKRRMKPF